jgi:hypothetical protein
MGQLTDLLLIWPAEASYHTKEKYSASATPSSAAAAPAKKSHKKKQMWIIIFVLIWSICFYHIILSALWVAIDLSPEDCPDDREADAGGMACLKWSESRLPR